MGPLRQLLADRIAPITPPLAVVMPDGERLGARGAAVTIRLLDSAPVGHIAMGQIGSFASDYVEGRLDFDGSVRELMEVAANIVGADPTAPAGNDAAPLRWIGDMMRRSRSRTRHRIASDAEHIQFHYDVSDEFYALWLDPRRVYSCAYYAVPAMSLAAAQEAKLDHICRKLMLQPGERFLDIGAGWGGLLMWAAEHYGVRGHGITLSRNQHAHVNRLIAERGLAGRVTMELRDYRDMPASDPVELFDKIASIGMFEHVGLANLPDYFEKIAGLLRPGGLLMNHGITAGGTRNDQLGAGMGDFIERHIFPGGELVHVSEVLKTMSEANLEPLDVENLRPHYAKTLWAWSDALEANLDAARAVTREETLRAYRLYLAGSAMSFEQRWLSLNQMLASRPDGDVRTGTLRGAQSAYPFNRDYIYRDRGIR